MHAKYVTNMDCMLGFYYRLWGVCLAQAARALWMFRIKMSAWRAALYSSVVLHMHMLQLGLRKTSLQPH